MKTVYIDDFKIHDIQDSASPYFIKPPIKGLEFAKLRISSHNKAGKDGIAIPSIFKGERRIELVGVSRNVTSADQHAQIRRAFLAALGPTRDSDGILIDKELRFTTMDDSTYRLLVQVVDVEMPWDQMRHSSFRLDILSVSDNIESFEEHSVTIYPMAGGGFVLPAVLEVILDAGAGGSATATNAGDETAYPIITLNGPLTNPRIFNDSTGEFIALTLTISDGESVEIDPAEPTVVQGGVTNRIGAVSDDSTYFGLGSGNTLLRLTTSVPGEGGSATFTWRDTFGGA